MTTTVPATLYTKTLQTTTHSEMVATTYLISEFDLTVPSFASLDISAELIERIDMIPGQAEVANITMPFIEDYTNYPEGFWFKVANGYAEIQIDVVEDVENPVTISYFWGRISGASSPLKEISLVANNIMRRGEITVADLLFKLQEVSAEDVITMIKANQVTYATTIPSSLAVNHYLISVHNIVGCCMAAGFGYTYANRVVIDTFTNSDIQFDRTGAGDWVNWTEAMVCLGDASSGYYDYFNSTSLNYWGTRFTAWELLVALSKNFGFTIRHRYASSSHQLELSNGGRDFTADTYSTSYESEFLPIAVPVLNIVSVDHISSNYSNAWTVEGRAWVIGGELTIPTTTTEVYEDARDPDISLTPYFFGSTPAAGSTTSPDKWLYADDGTATGVLVAIQATRHWDYSADAYDSTETSIASNLALYNYRKFGYAKRGYVRKYAQLKQGATSSHANIQILRSSSISDDISSRTFYAVETRKSLNGSLGVVWREL